MSVSRSQKVGRCRLWKGPLPESFNRAQRTPQRNFLAGSVRGWEGLWSNFCLGCRTKLAHKSDMQGVVPDSKMYINKDDYEIES